MVYNFILTLHESANRISSFIVWVLLYTRYISLYHSLKFVQNYKQFRNQISWNVFRKFMIIYLNEEIRYLFREKSFFPANKFIENVYWYYHFSTDCQAIIYQISSMLLSHYNKWVTQDFNKNCIELNFS